MQTLIHACMQRNSGRMPAAGGICVPSASSPLKRRLERSCGALGCPHLPGI